MFTPVYFACDLSIVERSCTAEGEGALRISDNVQAFVPSVLTALSPLLSYCFQLFIDARSPASLILRRCFSTLRQFMRPALLSAVCG